MYMYRTTYTQKPLDDVTRGERHTDTLVWWTLWTHATRARERDRLYRETRARASILAALCYVRVPCVLCVFQSN